MAITAVLMDTGAPAGSKLDPDMVAEIEHLLPGLEANQVGENELAPNSVGTSELIDRNVTGAKIALGGVAAENMAALSVATAALQNDSVTAAKAGLGVTTAYDSSGNPVEDKRVYMTAAQYAALVTKDPNTTYEVSA